MAKDDDIQPRPRLLPGLIRGLARFVGRLFYDYFWRFVAPVVKWGLIAYGVLVLLGVAAYSVVNPPTTLYMASERARIGVLKHEWVDFDAIAPVVARSVVAAEDANYCEHWGFDMGAIRAVIEAGESRGASTISQQVVKNVYLWPARSWVRKAIEATITPVMELVWSKQRILEVYLNMIEFDGGVFGIEAAAQHHFAVSAAQLSPLQAARLAVVLPDPKGRSAVNPGERLRRRAASVMDGAETIRRDGRASCFED